MIKTISIVSCLDFRGNGGTNLTNRERPRKGQSRRGIGALFRGLFSRAISLPPHPRSLPHMMAIAWKVKPRKLTHQAFRRTKDGASSR